MKVWILASALACGLSALSPARGDENKPAGEERPLRLVFITTCKDAAFFDPVKKGMLDAARHMGVTCTWTGTEGVDVPAQAALVDKAVADGFDGIALNIIDPQGFDEVVARAVQKGVPVVAFNTDDHATPNARLSAVNQRYREAGRRLAEHVLADIPEGSPVLLTQHDAGVSSLDDRLQGIQDVLGRRKVRWKVVVTGNDPLKGAEVVTKALKANPDIRAVLGTGQADTEAAGRAIAKSFAGQGRWSAGFDLAPETLRLIKAGVIRCTIDQQPYIQGFFPVVQLTLYLRYGIRPSSMDAGATLIDRGNVDRVMDLAGRKYR